MTAFVHYPAVQPYAPPRDRDRIAASTAVADFLAGGGLIQRLPLGTSAHPLRHLTTSSVSARAFAPTHRHRQPRGGAL